MTCVSMFCMMSCSSTPLLCCCKCIVLCVERNNWSFLFHLLFSVIYLLLGSIHFNRHTHTHARHRGECCTGCCTRLCDDVCRSLVVVIKHVGSGCPSPSRPACLFDLSRARLCACVFQLLCLLVLTVTIVSSNYCCSFWCVVFFIIVTSDMNKDDVASKIIQQ